ncbi:MAG TPA: hypothetical protein VGO47_02410 [Chlamydiales bacterium]|nr:hypothetical protein [Chlamydiales bacterium]
MAAAWAKQYDNLTDAYLKWESEGPPSSPLDATFHRSIVCYGVFESQECTFPYFENESIIMAAVRHGYIGNAPSHPSRAFSIPMLQLFHSFASRVPQLSLQRFIRGLCDLQQVRV